MCVLNWKIPTGVNEHVIQQWFVCGEESDTRESNTIYVWNHEMSVQRERSVKDGRRRGRRVRTCEIVATLLTPLHTHNSKSKAELLRRHRWMKIKGEDTEEGVFCELCEEREKKSLENIMSILFLLCHLVHEVLSPAHYSGTKVSLKHNKRHWGALQQST